MKAKSLTKVKIDSERRVVFRNKQKELVRTVGLDKNFCIYLIPDETGNVIC